MNDHAYHNIQLLFKFSLQCDGSGYTCDTENYNHSQAFKENIALQHTLHLRRQRQCNIPWLRGRRQQVGGTLMRGILSYLTPGSCSPSC